MTSRRALLLLVFALSAVALTVLLGSARGTFQEEREKTADDFRGPLEFYDDPPGVRPPAEEGDAAGGGPVTRGPFESVQVNVNAQGNNIAGDAANEPSIAIDPTSPDLVAIGWRQFDTVQSNFRQAGYGFSTDGGGTWTFPGVLTPGVFRSDPVLASDSTGTFYYYSLTGDFTCDMFISTDGGATWGPAIEARGGDKAWFTVDRTAGVGAGNLYVDWSLFAGCCGDRTFTRSTDGGQSYDDPLRIPEDIVWGTLAVGPDGDLFVSGRSPSDLSDLFVIRSPNAQDPLQTPVFNQVTQVDLGGAIRAGAGPNPGGLLGQLWVATDRSDGPDRGNVYLLGSVNPPGSDPLDVMFARSTDGGATFEPPIRVNDVGSGWQWFGTMSVAPNGRIDVIWNDTRNDPTTTESELFYAFSTDGGLTFSPNVAVTPPFNHFLGYPNQDKLGDYYHGISDDAALNLAFAATFNGEQDVYFTRLGDCNENGVHDSEEIEAGTSRDCNGNGIADECDIAAGTDPDDNQNGVIDSCELTLEGPDPGVVGTVNTMTVTGATPGAQVQFLAGKQSGVTEVPGCTGILINVRNPKLVRTRTADENGTVSVGKLIGEGRSGKTFHIVTFEPSTCNLSNVVVHTFP